MTRAVNVVLAFSMSVSRESLATNFTVFLFYFIENKNCFRSPRRNGTFPLTIRAVISWIALLPRANSLQRNHVACPRSSFRYGSLVITDNRRIYESHGPFPSSRSVSYALIGSHGFTCFKSNQKLFPESPDPIVTHFIKAIIRFQNHSPRLEF